ncbi:MAG TPA: hypothetical protein VL860_12495 [Planctomycetota bacterium]|nr:hypothetical protein [Planctomycetota bacterium]
MKLTRKELIVELPNRPGELGKICEQLQSEGLNIVAIMVRANANQIDGTLYLISDQPDTAGSLLSDRGYKVSFADVLCLEIVNRPGALAKILNKLGSSQINIEYCYVTSHYRGEPTFMIMRVSDPVKAIEVLQG